MRAACLSSIDNPLRHVALDHVESILTELHTHRHKHTNLVNQADLLSQVRIKETLSNEDDEDNDEPPFSITRRSSSRSSRRRNKEGQRSDEGPVHTPATDPAAFIPYQGNFTKRLLAEFLPLKPEVIRAEVAKRLERDEQEMTAVQTGERHIFEVVHVRPLDEYYDAVNQRIGELMYSGHK